ncbi:MAG: futalosine hydrolase [Flexistipes sinusarabici]|uniref:Futalosine hydrolase n=1 Tax=Flexistipes sinusarabici TaxID=2352 RepID=A0A5D0MTI6_FLESI|nr:futalosine hydrolase [Flexistipes sinusarabici]TYB35365.1 MAG: futalosine hydrolase [Flexistipes sinusarabici]
MKKNVVFVPTLKEAEKIFENVSFIKNDHGLYFAELNNIDVIITGIGKSNATFSSCISLVNSNYYTVYLLGICGAYRNSGLKPGDIVCITEDYFADEGLLNSDGEYKLLSEIGFAINDRRNYSEFNCAEGLKKVTGNTVSFLSGTDKTADLYQSKTKASVENMEGASIGMVCERLNISAYQVRAISNFCGDRKKQGWNIKNPVNALKKFADEYIF